MGRGAYSSSNNLWSAKRAAQRRISCKNVNGGFVGIFCLCGLAFIFIIFFSYFLWLFMQLATPILPVISRQSRGFLLTSDIFQIFTHVLVTSRKQVLWDNQMMFLNSKSHQQVLLPPVCSTTLAPNTAVRTTLRTRSLRLNLSRHTVCKEF